MHLPHNYVLHIAPHTTLTGFAAVYTHPKVAIADLDWGDSAHGHTIEEATVSAEAMLRDKSYCKYAMVDFTELTVEALMNTLPKSKRVFIGHHVHMVGYFVSIHEKYEPSRDKWEASGHGHTIVEAMIDALAIFNETQPQSKYKANDFESN